MAARTFHRRLHLVHGPTPLVHYPRLSDRLGVELWVKRDDMTGGVEAGNKLRKLEFLVADALAKGADTLVTCGALQSNHCRATAAVAARFGLHAVLFLRSDDLSQPVPDAGNALLMKLFGAELHPISPADYADRGRLLAACAEALTRSGRRPYVIPEGASNGLGSLGYVEAMREVREQLDAGLAGGRPFAWVAHACGSGGTAAGVALGASYHGVAERVLAVAVCDSRAYFEQVVSRIAAEMRALDPRLGEPDGLVIDDTSKGPRYGVASPEQRTFLVDVARASGLALDPVYTGKALFGLGRAVERDASMQGKRVLFLHTGGLPGLLAQGDELGPLV
ncbi:MAG TPA: D-cysteine desulfhydrase family protein [Polyangiaceae bacterium]|nr:D-cysteine desulfhydrase family protein [Polyangiaceae bacterium]